MVKKFLGGTVVERVRNIVEPIAEELKFDLWDIKFVKEGHDWYLKIFIDSDQGITIEDCEKMSKALDAPLEEKDPIPQSYCLEVSSPGVNRELVYDWHFEKFINREILIKLIRPNEDGNRELEGILEGFSDGIVTVKDNLGKEQKVSVKDTSYIKLSELK